MKRALQERAKQQMDPSASASSPSAAPPLKMAKTEHIVVPVDPPNNDSASPKPASAQSSTTTSSSTSNSNSVKAPVTSPRPSSTATKSHRRASNASVRTPRTSLSAASAAANADDQPDDAFYLRQQNKALSAELFQLQHQVGALEAEREARRTACQQAAHTLGTLEQAWRKLETHVVTGTSENNSSSRGEAAAEGIKTEHGESSSTLLSSSNVPPSTLPRDHFRGTEPPPAERDREWTLALSQQLMALGTIKQTDTAAAATEDYHAQLDQSSRNLLQRVAILQSAIQTKLGTSSSGTDDAAANNDTAVANDTANDDSELRLLRAQLLELTNTRQSVVERERKTRRDVYRLASGLLNQTQFLARFERADEQGNDADDDEKDLDLQSLQQQVEQEVRQSSGAASTTSAAAAATTENGTVGAHNDSNAAVSSKQLLEVEKKLQDAVAQVQARDASIQEWIAKWKASEQRINDLAIRQQSPEDRERLQSLAKAAERAEQAGQAQSRGNKKVRQFRAAWASSLADSRAAETALQSLQGTHAKRWTEIMGMLGIKEQEQDPNDAATTDGGNNGSTIENGSNADVPDFEVLVDALKGSETIMTLKHKLDQALEHVRQAESVKDNLRVALSMNSSLKQKLEETKGKYTTLQQQIRKHNQQQQESSEKAAQNHDRSSSAADTPATSATSSSKPENSGSSSSKPENSNKMHKEYRRMRKDLATLTASKDAAKAKLERAERERDTLMDSNARLLHQISEKDEMNANSLSTILHLKQLTEQLTTEKSSLEQQAKSANQLAVSVRLATNASERVSEELLKERQQLETRRDELEEQLANVQKELGEKIVEFSEANGQMQSLKTELDKSLARSKELVDEVETKEKEVRNLRDTLGQAERAARDARTQLDTLTAGSASPSGRPSSNFSVDQLNTQISVLKSRLACPVCHYRDKECIIMRCRHMHCKQCVEERISNRSRKCPTCNIKFSDKDVEDIWLS